MTVTACESVLAGWGTLVADTTTVPNLAVSWAWPNARALPKPQSVQIIIPKMNLLFMVIVGDIRWVSELTGTSERNERGCADSWVTGDHERPAIDRFEAIRSHDVGL